MLDATGKKLLRLMDSKAPPDLRTSAARVLGEIGVRDPEVTKALCEALQDDQPSFRLEVIAAIGSLAIDKALPQLLAIVQEGGAASEAAAQAAAHLGAKGIRALQELMGHVAPGLRRRIAAAMGVGGTTSAETAALTTLLDSDPGVVQGIQLSINGIAAGLRNSG